MFCDSDDLVSPFWAEMLIQTAKKGEYSVVACSFTPFLGPQKKKPEPSVTVCGKDDFVSYLHDVHTPQIWNKVFEAERIRKHALSFDEELSFGEDDIFVLDYLYACEGPFLTAHLKGELYQYNRTIPNSLSKQIGPSRYEYYEKKIRRVRMLGEKYEIPPEEMQRDLELMKSKSSIFHATVIIEKTPFPVCLSELKSFFKTEDYLAALRNPDMLVRLSDGFRFVLRLKQPLPAYGYVMLSVLKRKLILFFNRKL